MNNPGSCRQASSNPAKIKGFIWVYPDISKDLKGHYGRPHPHPDMGSHADLVVARVFVSY